MFLAPLVDTGLTKVGIILKQGQKGHFESVFCVLNDHCLTFCSSKGSFQHPDSNVLLTKGTKLFQVDEALFRVETGVEVLLLKAESDSKDWMASICKNVSRLSELPRGKFQVKRKGRTKECFLMLHRECISSHPSCSDTLRVNNIYNLTEGSSFKVLPNGKIELSASSNKLTLTAASDIERYHWCMALGIAIKRLRKEAHQTLVPAISERFIPLLCGPLFAGVKKRRVYAVLTEEGLYLQGKNWQPKKYRITPNTMLFSTTMSKHSFEMVTFTETILICTQSSETKNEWMYALERLIPNTKYDSEDQLQVASLSKDTTTFDISFRNDCEPGLVLTRRGCLAVATCIHERVQLMGLRVGSVLGQIEYEVETGHGVAGSCVGRRIVKKSVILSGFDSVVSSLSHVNSPLKLKFYLPPVKMGWLFRLKQSKSLFKGPSLVKEKVYVTLCNGSLNTFSLQRDGQSRKRVINLFGAAVALVVLNGGRRNFRVVSGLESVELCAQSNEEVMDWATKVAYTISLENGGGLLLEREKRTALPTSNLIGAKPLVSTAVAKSRGLPLEVSSKCPDRKSSIFRSCVESPIISKSIKSDQELQETCVDLFEVIEQKTSRAAEITHANVNTLTSLNPAEPQVMESFTDQFFVPGTQSKVFPAQSLNRAVEWPTFDEWSVEERASDASLLSSEYITNKYTNLDESPHPSKHDWVRLIQFAKS